MRPYLRSLWWKLAVTNVLVTLIGSLLVVMTLGPALDGQVFRDIVRPTHLATLIAKERALLGGRTQDKALVTGLARVMRQRLHDVEAPHGMYGIIHSSEPRVSLAVYGEDGHAVVKLEAQALDLPAHWLPSSERLEEVSTSERLLVLPLQPGGMLVVRHFAEFSVAHNLRSTLRDTGTFLWFLVLVVALPGLCFGLGLTFWLTQRLRQMVRVSYAWSRGDFAPRMDEQRRDELGRHALAMNSMADRLANHLRTEQELATLQERQRLARELHDGVKQQVFAAGLQMHAAAQWLDRDAARARESLSRAQDIITSVSTDVAEMLSRLQPGAATAPLRKSIERALQPWAGRLNLQLDIAESLSVPAETAHEVCRVGAEAVSNAVRHAKARCITVRLSQQQDRLQFAVIDDGRGFDVEHAHAGMGLASMHERVRRLPHGSLAVSSSPRGTQVAVTFQLLSGEPE